MYLVISAMKRSTPKIIRLVLNCETCWPLSVTVVTALPLIDVQFCSLSNGAGLGVRKTGMAAVGQSTTDFWNAYSRDGSGGGFLAFGALSNLRATDGTLTAAGLTVANAPGAWSNGMADPMYGTYLYPFDGGNVTVTITNLGAGSYDLYIYGHEALTNADTTVSVAVAGQSYGSQTTVGPGWDSLVWIQGAQYLRFTNVVVGSGQPLVVTVAPGPTGFAVISGLQIVSVAGSVPVAPVITAQPATQTVVAGSSVTFTVGVSGSYPLHYQWQFNGADIAGATGPALLLSSVQSTNAGAYSVTVTNAAGTASSDAASLTVTPVVYTPVALSQSVSLAENASVAITLGGTNGGGGTLGFLVLTQPTNGVLTGTAPNLIYTPSQDYTGPDSFTFQAATSQATSSPAQVTLTVLPESSGPLIDIVFGIGASSNKVGFAAIGQTANDYWNFYTRDDGRGGWLRVGCLTNLQFVNRTASAAGVTISNAPGAWFNGSSDPMYDTYLYPFDGKNISLSLTNLDAGTYNFYVYGHAAGTNGNSVFNLSVDQQSYGSQTNAGPGWASTAWQEGVQYVKFAGVSLSSGQTVDLTVLPGASGYALLSGLQIERVLPAAPTAPGAEIRLAAAQKALTVTPLARAAATPPPVLSVGNQTAAGFSLSFMAGIGRYCQIESTDNPASGVWTPLAVVYVNQSPFTFVDVAAPAHGVRFYRVVALR